MGNSEGHGTGGLSRANHREAYEETVERAQVDTLWGAQVDTTHRELSTLDSVTAISLLDQIKLPKLTFSQIENLNAPITTEEVQQIIKNLANNESPGPDGYSSEFYKITQDKYVGGRIIFIHRSLGM